MKRNEHLSCYLLNILRSLFSLCLSFCAARAFVFFGKLNFRRNIIILYRGSPRSAILSGRRFGIIDWMYKRCSGTADGGEMNSALVLLFFLFGRWYRRGRRRRLLRKPGCPPSARTLWLNNIILSMRNFDKRFFGLFERRWAKSRTRRGD